MSVFYDDSGSKAAFSELTAGKNIVVLCPGSTLKRYGEQIRDYIDRNNSYVISVNFSPSAFRTDGIFCANAKRVPNLLESKGCTRLITSNLIDLVDEYDYAFSFNDAVYFSGAFCEDSTLMLLKVLRDCGCRQLSIAGFDGFVEGAENYYMHDYTRKDGRNVSVKEVRRILETTLQDLSIEFLTPSAYENVRREEDDNA